MAAAATFPLNQHPDELKVTLADTNVRAVTIPAGTGFVSMYCVSTAGTLAFTGTDAAAQTTNAAPIPADSWHQFKWSRGSGGTIYIAGDAASVVHLLIEDR